MEQHRAVSKMLLELRLEWEEKIPNAIPPEYYKRLRTKMERIYAVGYDAGREEMASASKRLAQYDEYGKIINIFANLKQAVARTGFAATTIRRSMQYGRPCRSYYWEYINTKGSESQSTPFLL